MSTSHEIVSTDSISTIFKLILDKGNADYIGENVSQYQHFLQAGMLAREQGCCPELIVAALFHDCGHLLDDLPLMTTQTEKNLLNLTELKLTETKLTETNLTNLGVLNHEIEGSEYLRGLGFNEGVCDLVSQHVNAKRYLVSKYSSYYDHLSDASKETLKLQGGKMTTEEVLSFENRENFNLYLQLRQFDEAAKVENLELDELESFRQVCEQCLVNI